VGRVTLTELIADTASRGAAQLRNESIPPAAILADSKNPFGGMFFDSCSYVKLVCVLWFKFLQLVTNSHIDQTRAACHCLASFGES